MEYTDLNNLKRDPDQGGLYDLFTTTFINNTLIEVFGHVIAKEEEMRPDLVCKNIYKNMDHVSFLNNLNNVKNPLSVKAGAIWLYVNESQIKSFTPSSEVKDNIRQELINKNKAAKTDPKRKDSVAQDVLPPTIKSKTSPNVIVNEQNASIILGSSSASERPKP